MSPRSKNKQSDLSEKTISRAVGEELRRRREELGWSRLQLVDLLPSGIGDRTLLSYEHGTRYHTTIRFIELCQAMRADAPRLLSRGLQRAQIHLDNLAIEIDLRTLLNDRNDKFRPMLQWARNTLNEHPDGIVEVDPTTVRNLALFIGCHYLDLANYLARFMPGN